MDVTLLYFDGCPNWQLVNKRLRTLRDEVGFALTLERVETQEDAEERQFHGSPTVLVDGRDPFATEGAPSGLSCRLYWTPDGPAGAPTFEQLREALR